METDIGAKPQREASYRAGTIMIAVTLAACLAALVFRTPLRSRYWAWRVVQARGIEERAAPLTRLCNVGDAGRWGTETLLAHPDAEVRQFGVLVLQHVRSDWSRRRLLQMLEDPSEAAREMAALGLALQGDDSIISELKRLYAGQDAASASAACLVLERLATPNAVAALAALANVGPVFNRSTPPVGPVSSRSTHNEPADVTRRAALVDALAAIGSVDCAAALLNLLGDCRPCDVPTRDERLLAQLAPLAAESGLSEMPVSPPASPRAIRTIAERAAAALARITGLRPPFASDLSAEQREAAVRVWRQWVASRRGAP